MTAQEIINEALDIMQETAGDLYSNAELLNWVNMGQVRFCLLSNWLDNELTLPTVVGQAKYAFPTTIIKTMYVEYDSKKLKPTNLYELQLMHRNFETDTPKTPHWYYFPQKRVIAVYPAPDSIKNITIYGIIKPTALGLNDTPQIDDVYHDALVNFVLYKAKLKDNSAGEATIYLQEYMSYVAQAKTEGKYQDRGDKIYSFFPLNCMRR